MMQEREGLFHEEKDIGSRNGLGLGLWKHNFRGRESIYEHGLSLGRTMVQKLEVIA